MIIVAAPGLQGLGDRTHDESVTERLGNSGQYRQNLRLMILAFPEDIKVDSEVDNSKHPSGGIMHFVFKNTLHCKFTRTTYSLRNLYNRGYLNLYSTRRFKTGLDHCHLFNSTRLK